MFRRRRPGDPGFEEVAGRVERAKAALVAAVPSPRGVLRRSVADALVEFEEGLREAGQAMVAWSGPESTEIRRACLEGLEESLRRAERLRLDAPPLDYESLVTVLGDLMAPLDAFEEAHRRLTASD